MAANFFLPDDIMCNIIARLPAKPLLRFRCVSRYWNRILREPNFMKLRSRKTIILPNSKGFVMIDHHQYQNSSIFRRCYPIDARGRRAMIGNNNGIVLFAILDILVLYNPFTGSAELLPDPPSRYYRDAYGFGHGTATPDDVKIVRFKQLDNTYDVYSFKESSWSSWRSSKYNFIKFEHDTGHFVNGFLYWVASGRSVLIAVNLEDITLLEICLPFDRKRCYLSPLGTENGCLCLLHPIGDMVFDMWVMTPTPQEEWSKIHSFKLALNEVYTYPVSILDGKRILVWNPNIKKLILYDTSKDSYETFDNIPITNSLNLRNLRVVEFVESLASPSHISSFEE
ncbi:hypothetical protein SSX86_023620 [Deinandra increscens subsp. villosa]